MNPQIFLTLALLALASILLLNSLQRLGLWLISFIGRVAIFGMIAVGLAAIWVPTAPVVDHAEAVTEVAGLGANWSLPVRIIAASGAAVLILLPFLAALSRSAAPDRFKSAKKISCDQEGQPVRSKRRHRGESVKAPLVGVDDATSLMRRIAQGK